MTPGSQQGWHWTIPLAILVFGVALRFIRPLNIPLWYDEAATWDASTATWGQLLLWRHHFEHPPLSFALVKTCREVFGTDAPWALRLPSLVAGIACIPVAYWTGRRLTRSLLGGSVLALLVAGGISGIDQANQARMYTLLMLGLLLVIGLVATPAARDSWLRHGLFIGLGLSIGTLSHNLAWFAALALLLTGGFLLIRRRIAEALPLLLAVAVAGTLAAPGLWRLGARVAGSPAPEAVVSTEVEYITYVERAEANPDAADRYPIHKIGERVVKTLFRESFPLSEIVSHGLVLLGIGGIVVAAWRGGTGQIFVAMLLLGSLVALPVGLRYHHGFSDRYLIPTQTALLCGLALLAATPPGPRRLRQILTGLSVGLAMLIALWGGVRTAVQPPKFNIVGALLLDNTPDLRASEAIVVHTPKMGRLIRYYDLPDPLTLQTAPDPTHLPPEGQTFVLLGHFGSSMGPGHDPALSSITYLHDAATALGVDASADDIRQILEDYRFTLWRFDPTADDDRLVVFTGSRLDIERLAFDER